MFHYIDKCHKPEYADDNIKNKQSLVYIHGAFFNIITLKTKKPEATNEPMVIITGLTLPDDPGTKNPTTAAAKIILAKSEKNLEIESICALFSFGCILCRY